MGKNANLLTLKGALKRKRLLGKAKRVNLLALGNAQRAAKTSCT